MTTITATPDPATGQITVTIAKTEAITSLIRADVNGTRPVRAPAGVFPSAGTSGTITIVDHEAAFNGSVVYRAGTAAPRWTGFTGPQQPRFTLPFTPEITLAVDAVDTYSAGRESASTVHEILGREDDPIVVAAGMRSKRGTLEIILDSYAQAAELENLLSLGKPIMYRQSENPGQDLYFHASNISIASDVPHWKVSASFVGIRPPVGDRAAFGTWTFTTLAALPSGTFGTVAAGYDSFDTLTSGEAL